MIFVRIRALKVIIHVPSPQKYVIFFKRIWKLLSCSLQISFILNLHAAPLGSNASSPPNLFSVLNSQSQEEQK